MQYLKTGREKCYRWSWFLAADKCQIFPQIDALILGVWPGMSKLPKIASLLFLCNILRKKWVTKLIFWTQISMRISYKVILWFWRGWSRICKVLKIVCNIFTISQKKKLEMKLNFYMQINIKVSYKLILTVVASRFLTRWYY